MTDPVDRIRWVHGSTLTANEWNPNAVLSPELALLARSIMVNGWIQPIIVSPEGEIIDGHHRWSLSQSHDGLLKKYRGEVPVVTMDLDRGQSMAMTVRLNRAKGTHVGVRMSSLVRRMVDEEQMDLEQVAAEIGATIEEVRMLYDGSILKEKDLKNAPYSRAWKPVQKP